MAEWFCLRRFLFLVFLFFLLDCSARILVAQNLGEEALRFGDTRNIVSDSNKIFVVFRSEGDAFFSFSGDGGVTWSEPGLVASNLPFAPIIAESSEGRGIHFFYVSGSYFYHRGFSDGLLSGVHEVERGRTSNFSNAVSTDGKLHAFSSLGTQLAYYYSDSDGVSWSKRRILFESDVPVGYSAVASFNEKIYLLFRLEKKERELFFLMSPDEGKTWSSPVRVDGAANVKDTFSIVVFGREVHIVFSGAGETGHVSTFYRHSGDGGGSWGKVVRLGRDNSQELAQTVSADAYGNVFVAWFDRTLNMVRFRELYSTTRAWTAVMDLVGGFASYPEFESFSSGDRLNFVFLKAFTGSPALFFDFLETMEVKESTSAELSGIELASLRVNSPSFVSFNVENTGTRTIELVANVIVVYKNKELFSETLKTEELHPKETRVLITDNFTPEEANAYAVTVEIFSPDGPPLDLRTVSFEVGGEMIFDVEIVEAKDLITNEGKIPFTLRLKNLGDFFQDVDLIYWIESEKGEIISREEMPVAVKPKQQREFAKTLPLPASISSGKYYLKAMVEFDGKERQSLSTFFVKREAGTGFAALSGFFSPVFLALLVLIILAFILIKRRRRTGLF